MFAALGGTSSAFKMSLSFQEGTPYPLNSHLFSMASQPLPCNHESAFCLHGLNYSFMLLFDFYVNSMAVLVHHLFFIYLNLFIFIETCSMFRIQNMIYRGDCVVCPRNKKNAILLLGRYIVNTHYATWSVVVHKPSSLPEVFLFC